MLHNDPPEYQPDEESYADRWMRAHSFGQTHLGAWRNVWAATDEGRDLVRRTT